MTMSTTTIAGEQPITRLLFLLVLLFLLCTPQLLLVQSWSNNNFRRHLQRQRQTSSSSSYYYYSKKNDDNEEEKEEDWRDFRAKLVQQYRGDGEKITTTSSSSSSKNKKQQWAYESGDVIEKGSLIVSHPIQDFAYGGLRQQYFHKCVVLVLEHSAKFTKGIILNRPTKETMRDDLNVDWNVWFGGDVQGLDSDDEEFTCLHQLNTPLAQNLSQLVVKDMQCTPWEMAQFLVDQGEATLDDFWLGCGYAGWGPGQLQNELERGNWLMVAADSSSIFDLLRKNDNNNDNNRPEKEEEEEADTITTTGIGVWEEMIRRIGKQDLLRHPLVKFEDTMLRKWVLRRLFFQTLPPSSTTRCTSLSTDRVNMENLLPGTVIRANTPILLQDQVFHESLVLILESGNGNNINNKQQGGMTIGVILNRPTSKTINLRGTDLPIRYGGRYGLKQYGKPELWLHAGGGNNNNNTSTTKLQEACVGSPIIGGDNTDDSTSCGSIMFWQCTREDAETAVDMGLANVTDFIVVSGVSLWHHPAATTASNNVVDLETYFGYTHHNKTNVLAAWNLLKKQKPLDLTTMVPNLEIANLAWVLSAGKNEEEDISSRVSVPAEFPEITNENDPEENVAKVALELWVKTFLMKQ